VTKGDRGDDGFTLIELLVVLVIMPLIVGAIAAAIIVSLQDSTTTKARLTDSSNAQITSTFYVGDVEGAQYVTTFNVAGPFTAQSPQVCGATAGRTLVLGLYRPTVGATPGLSVGYWVTPSITPALVRDSCTAGTATPNNEVPLSDDVSPAGVSVAITPSQFATAAGSGWTPTRAATTVLTSTTLSGTFSLAVASTSGFQIGAVTVLTTAGYQTITCSGLPTANAFQNCSSPTQATVNLSTPVTQPTSISGINLSATELGSGYTYSVQATPRPWSAQQSGLAASGAALVSLGNITLTGGTLTVAGGANIGGTATVGGGTVTVAGSVWCANPGIGLCAANTATPVNDPLAPFVPTSATNLSAKGCPNLSHSTTLSPGIYSCKLDVVSGVSVTLNPGVYQLNGGITVGTGGRLQVGNQGGGALLYLPCPSGTCAEPASFSGGATVSLPPLTAAQSLATFNTTAMQGVWLWQAATDGSTADLIGNGNGNATGTAYLPGAAVDLSNSTAGDATGRIIASSVTMTGGTMRITGR
jgi:prepilin-type N-terminal cleavage/methylation domain-containing protein